MKLYQNLNVTGSLTLTGSLNTVGTITATTLVVQTITSSITAMTGSNIFGSLASNTQVFTGSMYVTGSMNITGSLLISGSQTISNGDLTISGNRNLYLSNTNTAAGAIRFYNATSATTKSAIGSYYNVADEGNLEFLTGGTNTRMMISSSGNIGIGTTSPSSFVDIRKNSFTPSSNASALLVEERGTNQMGIEVYIHNAGAYVSGRPSGGIGTINSLALRIAGGGIITGNFTSGGTTPFTPSATIASVLNMGDGDGFIFYTTGSLTAGTAMNMANYEVMRITSAGNVGIGVTPTAGNKFWVKGSSTSSGDSSLLIQNSSGISLLTVRNDGPVIINQWFSATAGFASYTGDGLFDTSARYCSINTPGSTNRIRLGYNDYGSGQYWGRIGFANGTNWSLGGIGSAGNDFSIGTAYNGTQFYIYANGNYSHSGSNVSDRRKKANINYITSNQLDNILKLKPVTFNKITDEVINENTHTGFIAQDIMESEIPNLVMGSEEDGYGLDYDGILALTVKAIQELKAEFDEYKLTHP